MDNEERSCLSAITSALIFTVRQALTPLALALLIGLGVRFLQRSCFTSIPEPPQKSVLSEDAELKGRCGSHEVRSNTTLGWAHASRDLSQ